MTLLRLEGATKGFNDRSLFRNVDFELGDAERVGLVGRNGSGKSSLLKILAGAEVPDEGERTVQRGRRIGYLEQEPELVPTATARDIVRGGIEGRDQVLDSIAKIHVALETAEGDAMQRALERLETLEHELEALGGHDIEHLIEGTLDSLDVPDPDAATGSMSGGERRRVALARLLVSRPDALLLDEPTNHLDAFVTDWLEDWFLETRTPLVLVTHDRYLLERVVDRIVEIDGGRLHEYAGGYSDYLEGRAARMVAEDNAEASRLTLLRRETAWIRRGPPARTTKSKARIKAYDQLVDAAPDVAPKDLELRIPPGPRLGDRVVTLEGLTKGFGGRTLLASLDLEITPGMRLGIIGPNGAGKSTLIRMITGQEPLDAGSREVGATVSFMGIDQGRTELDLGASVIENVAGRQDIVRVGNTDVRIESFLAKFGFDDRMRDSKAETLSGGERGRVMLAKLLLQGGNVLVLDEPTNDLDLATLRALEEALMVFPGAALIVTHDRWFLDRVATHVLYLDGRGGARLEHGDVSALLKDINKEREQQRLADQRQRRGKAKAAAAEAAATEASADAPATKKLSPWQQKELARLESSIAGAEEILAGLDAKLGSADLYAAGADPARARELQGKRDAAQEGLDALYAAWEELAG